MRKKYNVRQILCITLVLVLAFGAVGALASILTKKKSDEPTEPLFSAEASTYKDFQKFAYWSDENGKKVSSSNPYTYYASEEKTLTAVYNDFLDVKTVAVKDTFAGGSWIKAENRYTSGDFFNGFGYVTEPLTCGMTLTIEMPMKYNQEIGLSPKSRIDNPKDYAWGTQFPYFFIPESNIYLAMDKSKIVSFVSDLTTTRGAETTYAVAPPSSGSKVTVKIVLADKIQWYVNNTLVKEDSYDKAKEYFFSMGGCDATITEFGLDADTKTQIVSLSVTESFFNGKKITLLGDSITAGVGSGFASNAERYATVLCSSFKAVENNMGISGTTLCTGHSERKSRLADISAIPTDSDYVLVMLGTNDFDLASENFATLGTDGTTDTSTVYGAAEQMCKTLAERFADKKLRVFVVTPIARQDDLTSTTITKNGYTFRDFCNVLVKKAEKYGLRVIDLNAEAGLVSEDFANSLHPSASGTTKIVSVLKTHLLQNWTEYIPYEK